MTMDVDSLYRLLPAIHRIEDEKGGGALHAFIELFARELQAIEENLDQLHDDQFIETCADWVVPYIGDLIGYRPIRADAPSLRPGLNSPRAEVANTIMYRRRKGTALMLEELASNVTGWPAHAVEYFEQLCTSQYMNHVRLQAPATASVRSLSRMLALRGDAGAFNRNAHAAQVRRPESGGRFNIPNIGLFLWRLSPNRLQNLPLTPHPGDATGTKFRVNPLGFDLPLFRLPLPAGGIEQLATAANVPSRLLIRELALQLRAAQRSVEVLAETLDYGADRSLVLRRGGAVVPINAAGPIVPPGEPPTPSVPRLRIADLRDVLDGGGNPIDWAHAADVQPDEIALDPERGRILLGSARAAEQSTTPFLATFHYGAALDFGGGPYPRTPAGAAHTEQRSIGDAAPLQPLLDDLHDTLRDAPASAATHGRLTLSDSLTWAETPTLRVPGETDDGIGGHELVLCAANGVRPVLLAAADIVVDIGARGTLVLDGLVIAGGTLRLAASAGTERRRLVLRDCTLVPGLARDHVGRALSAGTPSLVIDDPNVELVMERCITGPLRLVAQAEAALTDCLVDADAPDGIAYAAPDDAGEGATLTLHECTVIGRVHAAAMPMASNTIFDARPGAAQSAPVWVERRQEGCVRFCVVPAGSVTPRKHRCVPVTALPQFASVRYGDPSYGLLRDATDAAIRTGADDDGEIGVMHALYQPLREANLRLRLDEYLRFGLSAGIFHAT